MSVTAKQNITNKDGSNCKIQAYPVLAGENILAGTFAVVGADGFLKTAVAANIKTARMVVIAIDSLDNTSGANGSVSTALNLVKCYVEGTFKLENFATITQAQVGKSMYITDNFTIDEVQLNGAKAGTLVQYLGATSGYLELNTFYAADGTIVKKIALTAAADGTGGGVLNWLNPAGQDILIEKVVLDFSAASTDALGAIDVGIAATGTSNDTLIDGFVCAVTGTFGTVGSAGTNGKGDRKMTSAQYLTITSVTGAHLDLTGMVGNIYVFYRIID